MEKLVCKRHCSVDLSNESYPPRLISEPPFRRWAQTLIDQDNQLNQKCKDTSTAFSLSCFVPRTQTIFTLSQHSGNYQLRGVIATADSQSWEGGVHGGLLLCQLPTWPSRSQEPSVPGFKRKKCSYKEKERDFTLSTKKEKNPRETWFIFSVQTILKISNNHAVFQEHIHDIYIMSHRAFKPPYAFRALLESEWPQPKAERALSMILMALPSWSISPGFADNKAPSTTLPWILATPFLPSLGGVCKTLKSYILAKFSCMRYEH